MPVFISVFGSRPLRRLWALAFLLLALGLAGGRLNAADPAPASSPFDEIKGDLKVLKQENAAALAPSRGTPSAAVPQFQPAAAGDSASLPAPTMSKTAATAKSTPANWLLEGMKLQEKNGLGQRTDSPKARRGETPLLDVDDPQFLLKLYLAQKSAAQAVSDLSSDESDLPAQKQEEAMTMDRYLKQWISPRDMALVGLGNPTAADGSAATAPPLVPDAPGSPSAAPAPNPYLATLKDDLAPPVRTPPPPAPVELIAPPVPELSPAVTPDKSTGYRPPPNPVDDKKYFPQLQRF